MNIILCPGHHAARKGAVNSAMGLNEHDEATKVVIGFAAGILEQAGHSVTIVTGRLRQKIDRINELHDLQRVDLAIDIHFNADNDHLDPDDYDNSRGDGCMVMSVPRSDLRMQQANLLSAVMSEHLNEPDLGGHEGWYWGGEKPGSQPDAFLMQTKCPAFIPEPGYIDNSGFADRCLIGEQWQRVAGALSAAIIAYSEAYHE